MSRILTALLAAAACLSAPGAASAAADGDIYGVWRNPKNSVHLEVRPCGASICGFVVWASEEAQADARRGTGQPLIGQQLLRDFAPDRNGGWKGKVFVPDMNRTFTGAARLVDAGRLEAQGCLLGKVLCKRQTWRRVPR